MLEADIPQVIRELCLTLDYFWFSSHMLDLLHHAGGLVSGWKEGEEGTSTVGAGLSEFFLLDYATFLCSYNSLWQVGNLYLDQCTVQAGLNLGFCWRGGLN